MGIFHKFVSLADDEDNPDIARPRDWNDDHLSPPHLLFVWAEYVSSPDTWTDQPSGLTQFFGDNRSRMVADLRFASVARLVGDLTVPGASGAELRAQYSDDGSTWNYLASDGGPMLPISSAGMIAGSWAPITNAAKLESVRVRLVGINGNAAADPKFRSVWLYVR